MMNLLLKLVMAGAGFFLLLQLVPYGRDHVNPPMKKEPKWHTTATRDLVKRACYNCHSNETVWPFYSKVAPASWLVYRDVVMAREELNFSEWQDGRRDTENPGMIEAVVMSGKMPPFQYRIAHPEARLSPEEKKKLVEGVQTTLSGR